MVTTSDSQRESDGHPDLVVGYAARDLSKVRPYRMSTYAEMAISRRAFMEYYGLQYSQIVENQWGFPIIPVPEERTTEADNRTILIPEGVDYKVAGHPVYWIDPSLTGLREEDQNNPVRWSLRMFFLIMGFGLWNQSDGFRWYDAPHRKGVEYSEADFQNFANGFASPLDKVRYTYDDLLPGVTYERIVAMSNDAFVRCQTMQDRQLQTFLQEQQAALIDAEQLLDPDASGYKAYAEELHDRLLTVWEIHQNKVGKLSDHVGPVNEIVNNIVDLLIRMERLVPLLSAPTIRSQSANQDIYARMTTLMHFNSSEIESGRYQQKFAPLVARVFDFKKFGTSTEKFVEVLREAEAYHSSVLDRLKLAHVNYFRLQEGKRPFLGLDEMDVMLDIENESAEEENQFPDGETALLDIAMKSELGRSND